MDLVFFGSATYSIPVLRALLKHDYRIIVVTTPDKPAGRHLKLTSNPLALFAKENGLTILKPNKLDQNSLKNLKRLNKNIKLGICCVYGKIIPQIWLNYFKLGIINLHPSLLPQYRGSSPAQFALLNNETETGVSFIKMDEECDHGPLVYQEKEMILSQDTAESLYQRLFAKAADKLPWVVENYLKGELKETPQDHSQASFTKMISKNNGLALKNQRLGKAIDLKRRALTPWPGLFTEIKIKENTKRIKILKTHIDQSGLVIDQVQLEGKQPTSFFQFHSAYPKIF